MWNENSKKWLLFLLVTIFVLVFNKWILPFCWPFVLAFVVVSCLYEQVMCVERRWHVPRTLSMGIVVFFMCIIIGGSLYFLVCRLMRWCVEEITVTGNMQSCCMGILHQSCERIKDVLKMPNLNLEHGLVNSVQKSMETMKQNVFPQIMNGSMFFGKYFFAVLAKTAVTIIMILLLTREYGSLRMHFYQIPYISSVHKIKKRLMLMGKVYLKAQGIIMSIITITVVVGMFIIKNENPVFMGMLTGILDVFPFIGTGIILIPYALWMFLQRKIWQSIVLLMLYGLCTFLRNLLEPKLIGKGMAVSPVIMLLAVFTGIRIYGISGVLLGPFSLILLLECFKEIFEQENKE